jgi:elongation factor G
LYSGFIAVYQIFNIKASLLQGSYHEFDSSDSAFQIAASIAFKEGLRKPEAGTILLEPIVKLEVVFPDEYQGGVQGGILSRRGVILGTEQRGNATVLRAEVPLSEMFGYTTELRSITSGRGSNTMEFAKYAPVPQHIIEEISKKRG